MTHALTGDRGGYLCAPAPDSGTPGVPWTLRAGFVLLADRLQGLLPSRPTQIGREGLLLENCLEDLLGVVIKLRVAR